METSKNINVVVIADNALFSELLRKSIELNLGEPASVDVFSSPDELRKSKSESGPDIVILDFALNKSAADPNYGIGLIKGINPEIPVIVISGKENMREAVKTLQSGASEFVLKDKFIFSHILNAVQGCLHPSKS